MNGCNGLVVKTGFTVLMNVKCVCVLYLQVYTWPTPSGWTLVNATEFCRTYLLASGSGAACFNQVAELNIDATLQGCVEDIQVCFLYSFQPDFFWVKLQFSSNLEDN